MKESLSNSEELFRKAFVTSPDSININRLSDGLYVSINKGFTKITGYTEEESLGKTSLELDIWADTADRITLVEGLNSVGKVENLETRFRMKDGSLKNGMMSATLIDLEGVPHILSITRDITEKKRIENALKLKENALREREEWFRSLFEQSTDGIFYMTIGGKIIDVNKSFAESHGYTQDEIQKMNVHELVCPGTQGFINGRLSRLTDGENLKFEVCHFHKDGHQIPLEVTAGMIKTGNTKYIIASHRDITERLKTEEALKVAKDKAEASDRLKTTFLNNISHEVRTPLNGILGFAEIISKNDLSDAEKQEALSMVYESSNRLLNTITNYMDISLLTSGTMSVNNTDINPSDVLNKVFKMYETACHDRNLTFMLELPEHLENMSISSDQEILQKILTHLLDNALKFTEKGSIRIGCQRIGEQIEFFVRDTGIGIEKDSLNNIFERFIKDEHKPFVISEGSGLGLSIARGMAEILGGKIRVESEPGVGSGFYLKLSLVKEPGKTISDNSFNKVKKIGRNPILIAEDDDTNFFYLNVLISRETSSKIIHAKNGREAIEQFKANPDIELVLMDIKMPEIDGMEATRQIKLINKDVPVIAITAYAMIGDEERILAAGCDSYLSKPISRTSLLKKLNEFVK